LLCPLEFFAVVPRNRRGYTHPAKIAFGDAHSSQKRDEWDTQAIAGYSNSGFAVNRIENGAYGMVEGQPTV
jgi:hypothetical protein